MSFSTKAHLFYGVNIEIPGGVEWETLDDDTEGGIKMIAYGSDGNSMYAAAVAVSVETVELDAPAPKLMTEDENHWPLMVREFCNRHGIVDFGVPAWRLAVERF